MIEQLLKSYENCDNLLYTFQPADYFKYLSNFISKSDLYCNKSFIIFF